LRIAAELGQYWAIDFIEKEKEEQAKLAAAIQLAAAHATSEFVEGVPMETS